MEYNKSYDLTYLKEISGGDDIFIEEMIKQFIEMIPQILEKITYYYNLKDWSALAYEVHKFAPNLAFVGLDAFSPIVDELEEFSRAKKDDSSIPSLISKIDSVCNLVIMELKTDYNI